MGQDREDRQGLGLRPDPAFDDELRADVAFERRLSLIAVLVLIGIAGLALLRILVGP
jgi:hypothetical protein